MQGILFDSSRISVRNDGERTLRRKLHAACGIWRRVCAYAAMGCRWRTSGRKGWRKSLQATIAAAGDVPQITMQAENEPSILTKKYALAILRWTSHDIEFS